MNYELCKELKDVGFPQDMMDGSELLASSEGVSNKDYKSNPCYIPTLSELIEACVGDKPNAFDLEYNDPWTCYEEENPDGRWTVRYYEHTPVGHIHIVGCKTPEIAVAKLWLALNKK